MLVPAVADITVEVLAGVPGSVDADTEDAAVRIARGGVAHGVSVLDARIVEEVVDGSAHERRERDHQDDAQGQNTLLLAHPSSLELDELRKTGGGEGG